MTLTGSERKKGMFYVKTSFFFFVFLFKFLFFIFFPSLLSVARVFVLIILTRSRVKRDLLAAFEREHHLFARLRATPSQINETTFCF